MIFSVHSSAEEMVASITVNDPGKHFPILRKTLQLIQSLERQIGNKKVTFQKKRESKIGVVLRNKISKERKKEREYSYMRN